MGRDNLQAGVHLVKKTYNYGGNVYTDKYTTMLAEHNPNKVSHISSSFDKKAPKEVHHVPPIEGLLHAQILFKNEQPGIIEFISNNHLSIRLSDGKVTEFLYPKCFQTGAVTLIQDEEP